MPSRNIVLRFDMRTSPDCPDSAGERYRAAIDMAAWADAQPVDVVGFSEHHGSDDGFISSPLSAAAAVASRTQRLRISVSALLVPLHDPLRLAEDITALDLLSNGRFTATAGLGYRQSEYALFGVDWARRGAVFDDKLSLLVSALSGDAVTIAGETLRLSPLPQSPLQSLLLVGGNSRAAARRAARFGLVFAPAIDDPALAEAHRDACRELGRPEGFTLFPGYPATTLLSDDPQRCWRELGPYLLFDATAYGAWAHPNRRAYAESGARSLAQLRAEGKYRILTPEQALATLRETGSLHLAPLTGGVPLQAAWNSLKLFEERVAPHL